MDNTSFLLGLNQYVGDEGLFHFLVWFSAEMLIVVILAMGSICLIRDKRISRGLQHLFVVFFGALLAWAASEVLNHVYPSLRPYMVLDTITPLFEVDGGRGAYPSGHTAFIFGFTTLLIFFRRKTGFVLSVFALLVGVSRVVAGVHWPIDIVGGVTLGVSMAFITYYIYRKQQEEGRWFKKLAFWK
jgi:undecaprenyl-diphosphatase